MKTTNYRQENAGPVYTRPSYMYQGGWKSFERGVAPGTVRIIDNVLSKAWTVTRRSWFRKPLVYWVSVDAQYNTSIQNQKTKTATEEMERR